MGQIKNAPFSLGSIVQKIIDCYPGNQNDARNQKIHSEVMGNFFEVKSTFLTGVPRKLIIHAAPISKNRNQQKDLI